jgi:hypothetical protein
VEVGHPVALDDRRVRQLDGGVADVVEERRAVGDMLASV